MMFGECPHCDAAIINYLAEGVPLPCYSKQTCESCGKDYWLKHSRVDPIAYADKPEDCGVLIKKEG